MKLTTLEIKGFKSFADKTVLHFNESITGVVGPNGCGKSNIVDAIRWVLGEQKPTAIRTEKMENLIFNGTKARKASGLAEVSLTFENTRNLLATEFSTVTISRHYYKTGESEYRINGVPCRLKDITGLFLDTGISTDSYAIIELGMLDDVLHNKDNSRRRLFEQAAGISKYKIRKKETLSKLNATQVDLDRVEDILFEIENNLKELEKQARKAQRYQKLKADYKANSIDLAVLTLQAHKDIYKQLANQQTYESDARISIESEIQRLEASIADEKTALIEKEQELSTLQKSMNAMLDEIRQKENLGNLNRERIKFLEERRVQLDKAIADANKTISETSGVVEELAAKAEEEQARMEALKEGVQEKLKDLDAARAVSEESRTVLEGEQRAYKQAEAALYEIDKKIAINKVRLENFQREMANLSQDKTNQEAQFDPLEKQLREISETFNLAEEELSALRQQETSLQADLETANNQVEEARTALAEAHRQHDARANEYQLTRNMVDSMEGYPETIRYIRKEIASMKDAPLLGDIINPDAAHKAAIESYLEPWLNHYIVQNTAQALEVIGELDRKEKGRANFFLLNEFKTVQRVQTPSGAVSALDKVQVDERYRPLAEQLLGHVFIVPGDRFAEDSARISSDHPQATIIRADGKAVRSGKTLSGGFSGVLKGNKLGVEKNLERMKTEVAQLHEKVTTLSASLEKAQATSANLRQTLQALPLRQAQEKVAGLGQARVAAQSKLDHAKSAISQIMEKIAGFGQMSEENKTESLQLEQDHQSQVLAKEAQHNKLIETEHAYRKTTEELDRVSDIYNKENIRYHQQQNVFQSISQELSFKRTRLEDARNTSEQNTVQLEQVISELELTKTKTEELAEELVQRYEDKKDLEATIGAKEATYYGSRGNVAETENKIKDLQKKKENSDGILNDIKDRLNDLKVELAGTKERLWVEFQVELDSILDNEPPEEVSLEELRERVDANKRRLENFGEVNPMAVQAYEEMKARYEFIKTQREDLLQAKESLLTTIDEIDQTARDKFEEAFNQVRQNFVEVFRSLFTEDDDCDLILKDGYDPLEADVEIIAKPKGKKPQVIDQLSGGEKTLTAMALLFALYLIKPAPFCILDEVDAPLDDNNIMKFNNMIRRFSDNSQFIIVTHNKRTMSQVDVIYGVTMAEQGISKVVPVDFRNVA
ncbi:MAG: chromosome segregation protein SMC [Chitinophagales bacterium]|nr:chromosome segregation protein SMC [Chitinophagales bacterium]MCB9019168.1 chromosome segregation protein SMC [Chitinophagales bacterium]MCB9021818.1 chromosome segregation protein SMC [Chitinophagales bacterium]MCB9030931.1 chromosome segregation protein SMC [Chitinophagales bacterium]HQU76944.1 chromosome segregation protein SMC [Chitinophagales bacterium]